MSQPDEQTPAAAAEASAGAAPDLYRRADGRLILRQVRDGRAVETPVRAVCCFPWSRRSEFISLRDDKGKEQRLIERLDDLPAAAFQLVEEELVDRVFVPRITAVMAIAPQAELFHWRVATDAGERSFLTARHDYLRSLPGGGVLIQDVGNDLYLVEHPTRLDSRSRRLLWTYLD